MLMLLACSLLMRSEVDPAAVEGSVECALGGAHLVCDEPVHDFGTIWAEHASLCHTFILRNVGTESAFVRTTLASSGYKYFTVEPASEYPYTICVRPWKLNGRFEKIVSMQLLEQDEHDARAR